MMRRLVRTLDELQRRRLGIREFCDDPECLFRIRVARAERPLAVADGEVPAGAQVLELHFWNEHFPRLPPSGLDLAWAARGQHMLIASLRKLARHLRDAPDLRSVAAVIGVTVLISPGEASAPEKLLSRLGFASAPYRSPLGRIGEFWENLYTWLIMWTFNGTTLRLRHLSRLHRMEVWMSKEEFVRRYAT